MKLNFRILERPVLHDFRRAKNFAAVNDGHFGGEFRQKGRLFHRGIAAAHHRDFLAAVEKSVAVAQVDTPCPISRISVSMPMSFAEEPGRDNNRFGFDSPVAVTDTKRTLFEFNRMDISIHDFRPETLRLLAHFVHQLGPHDAFGKTRKILDQRRQSKLPARLLAFDQKRLKVCPRGIHSRC